MKTRNTLSLAMYAFFLTALCAAAGNLVNAEPVWNPVRNSINSNERRKSNNVNYQEISTLNRHELEENHRYIRSNPHTPQQLIQLANNFLAHDDYLQAISYAELGIKATSDKNTLSDGYAILATAFLEQQQYPDALKNINKVFEYVDKSENYNIRAHIYHKLGQWKKAIKDYEIAIKRNAKGDARSQSEYAYALYKDNQYTIALAVNELFLVNSRIQFQEGMIALDELKEREKIQENLKKELQQAIASMKLNRFVAESQSNEGNELFENKNYKKALKLFSKALLTRPNEPEDQLANKRDLRMRAKCYTALEKYEAAIEDYTTLIDLDPDNKKFYALRAECYRAIGKEEEAQNDLAIASRTNTSYFLIILLFACSTGVVCGLLLLALNHFFRKQRDAVTVDVQHTPTQQNRLPEKKKKIKQVKSIKEDKEKPEEKSTPSKSEPTAAEIAEAAARAQAEAEKEKAESDARAEKLKADKEQAKNALKELLDEVKEAWETVKQKIITIRTAHQDTTLDITIQKNLESIEHEEVKFKTLVNKINNQFNYEEKLGDEAAKVFNDYTNNLYTHQAAATKAITIVDSYLPLIEELKISKQKEEFKKVALAKESQEKLAAQQATQLAKQKENQEALEKIQPKAMTMSAAKKTSDTQKAAPISHHLKNKKPGQLIQIALDRACNIAALTALNEDKADLRSSYIKFFALQCDIIHCADALRTYTKRVPNNMVGKLSDNIRTILKHIPNAVSMSQLFESSTQFKDVIASILENLPKVHFAKKCALDQKQINQLKQIVGYPETVDVESDFTCLLEETDLYKRLKSCVDKMDDKQSEFQLTDNIYRQWLVGQMVPLINAIAAPLFIVQDNVLKIKKHEHYNSADMLALEQLLMMCGHYTKQGNLPPKIYNFYKKCKEIYGKLGHEAPEAVSEKLIRETCELARQITPNQCDFTRPVDLSYPVTKLSNAPQRLFANNSKKMQAQEKQNNAKKQDDSKKSTPTMACFTMSSAPAS